MLRDILRPLVPPSLRLIPRKLGGSLVDWFYGISTEGYYSLTVADQERVKHLDATSYQPCSYLALWMLSKRLPMAQTDVLYDLGCGKGRAVCFFGASGRLRKCVGVELVPMIADHARRNAAKLSETSPIDIITDDAAAVELSEGTIFLLFNPFGRDTLRAVLANIDKCRNRRRIFIVCFRPYLVDVYDACPWLEPYFKSARFCIWKSVVG